LQKRQQVNEKTIQAGRGRKGNSGFTRWGDEIIYISFSDGMGDGGQREERRRKKKITLPRCCFGGTEESKKRQDRIRTRVREKGKTKVGAIATAKK